MNSGVYILRNTVTGEEYVGSTENLSARKSRHFSLMRHGQHENPRIRESCAVHGESAFRFEVVDRCPSDVLESRERALVLDRNPAFNIAKVKRGAKPGQGKPPTMYAIRVKPETKARFVQASQALGCSLAEAVDIGINLILERGMVMRITKP